MEADGKLSATSSADTTPPQLPAGAEELRRPRLEALVTNDCSPGCRKHVFTSFSPQTHPDVTSEVQTSTLCTTRALGQRSQDKMLQ